MSELHEAATWLVYAIAAVLIISSTAAAILFGLALRFLAEFLRELASSREGDAARQHTDDGSETPVRAKGSG